MPLKEDEMEGTEAENCNQKFKRNNIPKSIADKLKEIINDNNSIWFMVVEAYDLGRKHAAPKN